MASENGYYREGIFESIFSLSLGVLGEFAYSLALLGARGYLVRFPVIFAIMPIMASKRGALYSTLGARMSTYLHLGKIRGLLNEPWVRSQYVLNFFLIPILAVFEATVLSIIVLGFRSFPIVFYVSTTASYLALIILYPTTIQLAVKAFRRGWDPDHMLSPLITVISDSLTLPTLLLSIVLYAYWGTLSALAFFLLLLSLHGAFVFRYSLREKSALWKEIRSSLTQVSGSTMIAMLLESFTGGFLVKYTDILVGHPVVLASIPVLMQASGALSNIMGSKISTLLHLGLYPSSYRPSKEFAFLSARILAIAPYLYVLVGAVGIVSSLVLGVTGGFLNSLAIIFASGVLLVPIIILLSHFLSVVSFKHGLNPDNITLPLQTALMDLLSIVIVTTILTVF